MTFLQKTSFFITSWKDSFAIPAWVAHSLEVNLLEYEQILGFGIRQAWVKIKSLFLLDILLAN